MVGALGVVFGDIGTSPIYTLQTVFNPVFRAARKATFTPDVLRGPLAARPYDLRHAAVSTWLAAGVPGATVAQWAG